MAPGLAPSDDMEEAPILRPFRVPRDVDDHYGGGADRDAEVTLVSGKGVAAGDTLWSSADADTVLNRRRLLMTHAV